MSTTISPNMALPIPGVGTESGPDYAFDINQALSIIDQHNHSSGSGVQITPAGLNINAALTLNSNFLRAVAGISLQAQGSLPAVNTIYESGVDLYYVDGIGNNIQITANGGIAGSPGSISNLVSPASASYVSGSSTFVWQSNTSIAANMDFGSAIFRNLSPNSTFGVTVNPPAALASNYSLTLPTIPASASFLTIDTSGNIGTASSISGAQIASASITGAQIAASTITLGNMAANSIDNTQLLAGAVTTVKINDGAVTRVKQAPVGQQISSSSGSFSTSSTSYVNVTNLAATITTTGRPIIIIMQSDNTGSDGVITLTGSSSGGPCVGQMQLLLNSGDVTNWRYSATAPSTQPIIGYAPNYMYLDVRAAGTYTYQIQAKIGSNTNSLAVTNVRLVVYEL